MSTRTACPRCARLGEADDRFCGGCGAERTSAPAALTAAVDAAFDPDDAPTGPIRLPRHARPGPAAPRPTLRATPPRRGPEPARVVTPPPMPPPPEPEPEPEPDPSLTGQQALPVPEWTVVALAGAAAVVQFVTAVTALPTASVNGADWSTLAVATLPAFGFVAAATTVAVAALRRAPATPLTAATLAVAALVAGLASSPDSSPGAMVGMLVVATAGVALVDGRFALEAAAAERPLVRWWTGGCGLAALYEFVVSHEVDGGTSGQVFAGVVFLVLGVAGVVCASELRTGRAAPRWTLVIGLPVTFLAVVVGDAGGHVVWPLLVLHAVLAVVVVRPLVAPGASGVVEGFRARLTAMPPAMRLGLVAGSVVLTGVVLALARWTGGSGSSDYSDYSGDYGSSSGGAGSVVVMVIVGVLALAAAFTPTMTPLWRGGLVVSGGLALWFAWDGSGTFDDGQSALSWSVFFPLVIIGSASWGAWTNHRTGATASRPGWVGEGVLPPMIDVPFVAPPTAGARSRTCLEVLTTASPDVVLDAVVRATAVRGNWFRTYGDEVSVTGRTAHLVGLKIGGTCTFRAMVSTDERTVLRLGGMDTWTKSRWYYDFVVPMSPAKVEGFRMYKLYLRAVASEIARIDPSARSRIGQPST